MSPVSPNEFTEGYDHSSSFSLHEDDIADQLQEHQSTRPELPAEIPDSQPEPYLPSEIPDSQPDTNYHQDLSFFPDYSEVSSQLPSRDHGDLPLGDPNAFVLDDYDLREVEAVEPWKSNFHEQKQIDPRVDRFDRIDQEEVDDSTFDQVIDSSSTVDTEIIPGGTRLTNRLGNRIVSLQHRRPISTIQIQFPRIFLATTKTLSRVKPSTPFHCQTLAVCFNTDYKWSYVAITQIGDQSQRSTTRRGSSIPRL